MYGGTLSLMGTPTVIHGGCHLGMHEWTSKYVQASSREMYMVCRCVLMDRWIQI